MESVWKYGIGLSIALWIAILYPFGTLVPTSPAEVVVDIVASLLFVGSIGFAVYNRRQRRLAPSTPASQPSPSAQPATFDPFSPTDQKQDGPSNSTAATSADRPATAAAGTPQPTDRLETLRQLRDTGLVSDAEYERKRATIETTRSPSNKSTGSNPPSGPNRPPGSISPPNRQQPTPPRPPNQPPPQRPKTQPVDGKSDSEDVDAQQKPASQQKNGRSGSDVRSANSPTDPAADEPFTESFKQFDSRDETQ